MVQMTDEVETNINQLITGFFEGAKLFIDRLLEEDIIQRYMHSAYTEDIENLCYYTKQYVSGKAERLNPIAEKELTEALSSQSGIELTLLEEINNPLIRRRVLDSFRQRVDLKEIVESSSKGTHICNSYPYCQKQGCAVHKPIETIRTEDVRDPTIIPEKSPFWDFQYNEGDGHPFRIPVKDELFTHEDNVTEMITSRWMRKSRPMEFESVVLKDPVLFSPNEDPRKAVRFTGLEQEEFEELAGDDPRGDFSPE